jgi:hypothetical protein
MSWKLSNIILAGLSLAAIGRADTIGSNPTVDLPVLDTCSGCSFAYIEFAAANAGQTVTSYSFFAGAGTGSHRITPLLFESTGVDTFQVIGIGATQSAITANAENTFSFSLQSGTATVVGANTWFGWIDGAPSGATNAGTITASTSGGIGQYYAPAQSISLNGSMAFDTFAGVGQSNRTYSLDVNTASMIQAPEPSALLLLVTSLLGVGWVSRKRIACR